MSTAAVISEPPAEAGARARLEVLCDEGSFRPIRSGVLSHHLGARARASDGVIAGAGLVDGRPVFCYSQDPAYLGGSLGEAHADTIVRVMRLAGDAGAPVVGFVESGGARLQEGHAALGGYGRIFRATVELSRRVPQISIVSGVSAGGGAYSPALTDFVVMTDSARMFLTGPKVVRQAMGEEVSMEDLGGPRVHGRNGVSQLVAADEAEAIEAARRLLALLPSTIGEPPHPAESRPPEVADPASTVPEDGRRVYDMRDTAAAIFDGGSVIELYAKWATSMFTGFARLSGTPVGVVANQPRRLGGVIDAQGAEKAARFVRDCDRFGLPLVVLVDTPGFMPGRAQEEEGVIRHGASLLRAFAAASVPKLTVVLRKAYGGAVITMNSKDLGADLVFAWPRAEIGIMAASQAVGIVHRRELQDPDGPSAEELTGSYAERHLNAAAAAASGYVDEVIEPAATRDSLVWALASLNSGRARQARPAGGLG